MAIKVVKDSISRQELTEMANAEFSDIVKAVVDLEQRIMVIGGELHADEEVLLAQKYGSKRENTWGVNLFPKRDNSDWVEFDSMVNLKPHLGNRSRGVENPEIREKILEIIEKLVKN